MITIEQFTELAHRTASRYSHRSEPARAFYTFSPEALADFHRQVCAASAQAQRVPEGWRLVPVEPTPKMLVALWEHRDRMRGRGENAIAREGYSAMLASTPAQPAQQEPSIPAEFDVRTILLSISPGEDGMGHEVYAASVADVESQLTSMGQELEEWQLGIRRLPTAAHQEPPQPVERKPMTDAEAAVKSDRERIKAGIMALTMTAESCRGDAGVDTARKALALRIVTLIDGHGDLVLNEAGKRMAESLAEGHQ